MQYPIIDTIVEAYQRNGWTGLDIIEGYNLFNPNTVTNDAYISNDTGNVMASTGSVASDYIPVESDLNYVIQPQKQSGNWGAWYDVNKVFISGINSFTAVRQAPQNAKYLRFTVVRNGNLPNWEDVTYVVQADSISDTHFEPYVPPTTDIKNRLKLPMIHYFPHPVIDALQRAAAGTQTVDDTEILRHYLTPLGIGGI